MYSKFRSSPLALRILMGLSGLLFIFVMPLTFYRLVIGDWKVFALDLFLVSSAALIFACAYRQKYVRFSQIYMCLLVSIGSTLTVVLGGVNQVYWIYPASLTMFFLVSTRTAYLYVFLMCTLIFAPLQTSLSTFELINVFVALFGTTSFITVFANEIKSENRNLDQLATHDFLTESGNRRAFDHKLRMLVDEFQSLCGPVSLIVLDIDDFKSLNDNHGHGVGDNVLKHLVKNVNKILRKTDMVYRIGGEEFAILITDATLDDAQLIAEKIRKKIDNETSQAIPAFTVSLGVSSLLPGESGYDWLRRADMAMYTAKKNGKNQVKISVRQAVEQLNNEK